MNQAARNANGGISKAQAAEGAAAITAANPAVTTIATNCSVTITGLSTTFMVWFPGLLFRDNGRGECKCGNVKELQTNKLFRKRSLFF